jgi:sugar lactone lactonase YvrE
MEPSGITPSHPVHHEERASFAALGVFAFLAAMIVLCGSGSARAQTIPGAVIYQANKLVNVNGNAGHIAANNLGDVFYVSQTDNIAYWLPRGASTPVSLVTGLSGGRSVTVDAFNNVYVSSNYSGRVIEVPYVNGTYATGTANSSGLPTCTAAPTAPCLAFGNGGGATGYYLQASDIAFDRPPTGAPNAYVIDERDNNCNQTAGKPATSCNTILKFTPANNGTYTAAVLVTGLPQTNNGQIAAGPNGDVYYADGTNVYFVAAGTTSAVTIGTGLTNPAGVTTDYYGNLYITNASTPNAIIEMPAVNGVAQPNQQFTFLSTYSANGIAFDGLGDVYYTGYSGQTNLNVAKINAFSLGTAPIGTAVSTSATTLTVQFNTSVNVAAITPSGTPAGFSYVAGTCAPGAYSAGNTCNFNVNYTPTTAGLQKGSVSFTSATGSNIVVASLSGIGMGVVQTSDPGTISTIGSGLLNPQGIAVDSAQNVYIADQAANAVFMYPAGSSTGTSIGSGLVGPTSVALDNSGNLYIADSGNGRVVQVPNIAGTLTSSAQNVIMSGLGTELGIATDQNSNLYIADSGNTNSANNKVLQLGAVAGIPNSSAVRQMGVSSSTYNSIFTAPIAVATDSTGNLFVADTTANTVTEITYYGQQTLNIGTGYSHPTGLATDASGSLYVADSGNGLLLKIPFESPIFNTNDEYVVGGTILAPYGVALDGSANLYVVDSANASAYAINRAQGALPLGRGNINTSTSQLKGYIGNAGNQPLILGNPAYVATGDTSVFTITSSPTGCVNSATITPGFACSLSASFGPTVVGIYSELLSFTSNATNTATPSLTLTGTGLNQSTTTIALAQTSPSGTAPFGQAVIITATITSTKAGTPTGTVAFSVDGGQAKNVKLTGNTAQITLSNLTGGSHVVSASYSGDLLFAPSNTVLSVAVAQASSTTVLTSKGGNHNPDSATPGTLLTLIATITPGASTVPTGQVTFTLNGKALAPPATVAPKTTVTAGVSATTYQASISTSTLPAGLDSIVATYSGDVNYVSSANTLGVTITPMTFTLTPAATSVTVTTGQTITTPLQVTSLAGAQGFVGLSCTGLPANVTCGFSPNNFILQPDNVITAAQVDANNNPIVPATNGPMNITLSVITGTSPVVPQPPVGALKLPLFGKKVPVSLAFLLFSPIALAIRNRRALKHLRGSLNLCLALLALFGSITMFTGCGSKIGVTPQGAYTVTIRAITTVVTPSGASVANAYVGAYAPGCSNTPAGSVDSTGAPIVTCEQDAQLSLTVKQ